MSFLKENTTPKVAPIARVFGQTPGLTRSLLDSFTTCKIPGADGRDLHLFIKEPPMPVFNVLRSGVAPNEFDEKQYTHPIVVSCLAGEIQISPLFSCNDPGGLYLPHNRIEELKLVKRDTIKTRYGQLNRYNGPITINVAKGWCDDTWLVTLPHIVQLPSHFESKEFPQQHGILDVFTLRSHAVIFKNGVTYIVSQERWDKTFARFNPQALGKRRMTTPALEESKRKANTPCIVPTDTPKQEPGSKDEVDEAQEADEQEHVDRENRRPSKLAWDSDDSPVKAKQAFKSQFDSSDEDE